MELSRVVASHWNLRNPAQVKRMVDAILMGSLLPPVDLFESSDGVIQILDGHHRCVAYWLAGVQELGWGEFLLLPSDEIWRPRCGTVPEMADLLFGERSM